MMRDFDKAILRWIYVAVLYALCGALLYWLMDRGLMQAGLAPLGYMLTSWMANCRNMFFNNAIGSLALVALWNLLYSWKLLGGHNPGRSVNVLNAIFLLLHLLWFALTFYMFTMRVLPYLLGMPTGYLSLHFLPALFIIPFFFATRLLGPESAAYRFRILNKLRAKIGLRYV